MLLSDGRRIVPATHPLATSGIANIIISHPDFRMIVLANRPGFPFLGNDFFGSLGNYQYLVLFAMSLPRDVTLHAFQYIQCKCTLIQYSIIYSVLWFQVTSSAAMPLTTQAWNLRSPSCAPMVLTCLKRSCGTWWGHLVSCGTWQTRRSSSTHTQPGKLSTSSSTSR